MHPLPVDVDGLPYDKVALPLLNAIFQALATLTSARALKEGPLPDYLQLNTPFSFLTNTPRDGKDRHLSYYYGSVRSPRASRGGLLNQLRRREKDELLKQRTRMSSLVLQWFDHIDDLKRWRVNLHPSQQRNQQPVAFLPSPLAILFDLLTDPDDLSTRAYAHVTVRNILLRLFRVMPSGLGRAPKGWTVMTPEDVSESLSTISTFHAGRDNLPGPGRSNIDAFVRHFLAARGLMHLRFGSVERKASNGLDDRVRYCRQGILHHRAARFEFRTDPDLARVPDLSEIENEIWGVPLAVRGADVVFFGGMQFSETGGLVVGIAGGPGMGKTSLALSLVARLAPLGAGALFITAEEARGDLYARISSIVSDRTKRLSFAPRYDRKGSKEWLSIRSGREPDDPFVALSPKLIIEFLSDIQAIKKAKDASKRAPRVAPPHPCRLVVVLDNLHSFFPDYARTKAGESTAEESLEQIIAYCRSVGALVITTFARDWAGSDWIDYYVDTSIELQYEGTDERGQKPSRLMILRKTRQQISRPGAHGFHMSGGAGFRITPQIPSQLDKKATFDSVLPELERRIDIFRRPCYRDQVLKISTMTSGGPIPPLLTASVDRHLRIAKNSHILIHGKGSGGKAGLALKIAVAPLPPLALASVVGHGTAPKVLIVSFLYPKQYYLNLVSRLHALAKKEYEPFDTVERAEIDVLALYPGYIQPEDLFDRINRRLDKAELEGEPFTALLLDGLHNVGLQFPLLQAYPMLWPALHATLRRRRLTVITTHAIMTVESGNSDAKAIAIDDPRSLPLLQALVQGSDYVIAVDRVEDASIKWPNEHQGLGGPMAVKVVSSNYQEIPQDSLYWSRDKLVLFVDDDSEPKLDLLPAKRTTARRPLT